MSRHPIDGCTAWRTETISRTIRSWERGCGAWSVAVSRGLFREIAPEGVDRREGNNGGGLGAQHASAEAHRTATARSGHLLLAIGEPSFGSDEKLEGRIRGRHGRDRLTVGYEEPARHVAGRCDPVQERKGRPHFRNAVATALLAGGDRNAL